MKTFFNAVYAFCIAANTALIAINLYEFDNMKAALFNFACALLCWIGYYRTKEDGNKSGN